MTYYYGQGYQSDISYVQVTGANAAFTGNDYGGYSWNGGYDPLGYVNVTGVNYNFAQGGNYYSDPLAYVNVTQENAAFAPGGAYYQPLNYVTVTPQNPNFNSQGQWTGQGANAGGARPSGGGGSTQGGGGATGGGGQQGQQKQQPQQSQQPIRRTLRPALNPGRQLAPLVTGAGINQQSLANPINYTYSSSPVNYSGTNWGPFLLIGGAGLIAYMAFGKTKH